tara:strand:+ start:3721 stop:4599 length:879 start_codon:yes stop_codon:yes gene_type:complete
MTEIIPAPTKPEALTKLFLPLLVQESLLPLYSGPFSAVRRYGNVSLSIQGGIMDGESVILPSGTIARRLLHYLISVSRRTKSPVVDLVSAHNLTEQIGTGRNPRKVRKVKQELLRLSRMTITIDYFPNGEDTVRSIPNLRIFRRLELSGLRSDNQMSLFGSFVEFDREFYEMITCLKHQPIKKEAVWSLRTPLSIDVYLWLSRRGQDKRLTTDNPLFLSWDRITEQFSRGEQPSKFKSSFKKALEKACEQIQPWDFAAKRAIAWTDKKGVYVRSIPQQVEGAPGKPDELPRW